MASMARLVAWIGIVFLGLYMTVGEGSGWYGVYSVDLRIFSLLALAVVFGAWTVAAIRSPAWRPRSRLWAPIAAVLAAFLVSSVTSWNARISLEYAAYAAILAGLYLLL